MCQDLEILVLELKIYKTNWLVIGNYKPPSLSDIVFTPEISNNLTIYQSTHGNVLLMGDFSMTPNNPKLSELIDDHELCTLIATGFKSINPICIDNFLNNKKTCFMETLTFETGAFDPHKLTGTMLRSTFAKEKPKKMFTISIKTLTIKGLRRNYKSSYSQCQILNHFILHLKSF